MRNQSNLHKIIVNYNEVILHNHSDGQMPSWVYDVIRMPLRLPALARRQSSVKSRFGYGSICRHNESLLSVFDNIVATNVICCFCALPRSRNFVLAWGMNVIWPPKVTFSSLTVVGCSFRLRTCWKVSQLIIKWHRISSPTSVRVKS